MDLQRTIVQQFQHQFGNRPTGIAGSPGRVNLIGDHTDYNEGWVLPMAIDRRIQVAFQKSSARRVSLFSLGMDTPLHFSLDDLSRSPGHWGEYVKGVAWVLQEKGYRLHGWKGVVAGDIPIGSGLSSSAALEIAAIEVFQQVSGFTLDIAEKAAIGQMAENRWVGIQCGVMDQLICAGGQQGMALLIDCRDISWTPVALPTDTAVVILDTGTRRGLVDSAYNRRRGQCETAARHFGLPSLRNLTPDVLAAQASQLDPVVRQRANHVITENRRTREMADALRRGDTRTAGRLMNRSHASLRDDFEVSSPALDAVVSAAIRQDGCLGARMTGAGFGGCAVALIQKDRQREFVSNVAREYREQTGIELSAYVCQPSDGASAVEI